MGEGYTSSSFVVYDWMVKACFFRAVLSGVRAKVSADRLGLFLGARLCGKLRRCVLILQPTEQKSRGLLVGIHGDHFQRNLYGGSSFLHAEARHRFLRRDGRVV